jgi:nicotinate-nucleotide pyrophosphorylase (carboxylating)
MWSTRTRYLIDFAIGEDLSDVGDLSAQLLPEPDRPFSARVVAREGGVAAGLALVPDILSMFARRLATNLTAEPAVGVEDGSRLERGATLLTVSGGQAAVLTAERTLLNFLGRLCGVASLTRRYVDEARAGNANVQVLDTRKTVPGWRELDKYAVRCGGGTNHRLGLFDAVLIKDNHLAGVPVSRLAEHVRGLIGRIPTHAAPRFVEVEVDSLEQFDAVVGVPGVQMILLDNFPPANLAEAVRRRDARGSAVLLEASGGVTLETVREIAATGVDRISVGAITHSERVMDLGLDAGE